MVEKNTSMRGSCLCRAVTYAVTGRPGSMWHCHCVICRKLSGAAFATHMVARASDFVWLRGQALLTHYALSATLIRSFLSAEQLKRRSAVPSTLTLHGLVRHMAEVEREWFRINFAGQVISSLYSTEAWPNADFDDLESADPATDFATFAEEIRLARAVTVGRSLDDTFVHPQRGIEINLRWVYIHMIEEYARRQGTSAPNHRWQATAYSVRSCHAPAAHRV